MSEASAEAESSGASVGPGEAPRSLFHRSNIPNLLTTGRLLVSALQFAIFSVYLAARVGGGGSLGLTRYAESSTGLFFRDWEAWILNFLFLAFLVSVATDWLDGYLARKWKVVSTFGRIADPFADKIFISGSFVLFLPLGEDVLPVAPWMVVVMLAREYLVTSIRGFAESQGIAFGASIWGKLKMITQCICVGALMAFLANAAYAPSWSGLILRVIMWLTLIVTVGSGWVYIEDLRSILKERAKLADKNLIKDSSLAPLEPKPSE